MPQGKGTYGSQVGRPPKKKYYGGGKVGMSSDPFSSKNPEGIAVDQVKEMTEEKNEEAKLQKFGEEHTPPESNAMERSQTFQMGGNVLKYKKGGKV